MINAFETAITFKGNDRKEELVCRLKDYKYKDILAIYKAANSCDGSFDFVDVFKLEDIDDVLGKEDYTFYDIVGMVHFGNVKSLNGWFSIDINGNLQNIYDSDLSDYCYETVDQLADWLGDNYWKVSDCLYGEDRELLEAWDDIDNDLFDWRFDDDINE